MKRCSVFTICSEALDMLKYSTNMAINRAGTDNFDFIVILFDASDAVKRWSREKGLRCFEYHTKKDLSFMANLRNCFNEGFMRGFMMNEYTVPINTDNLFYNNWLVNLMKYTEQNRIVNCKLIEPGTVPTIHTSKNFGEPTEEKFDLEEFDAYCKHIYQDKLIHEKDYGRRCDATPYILHKNTFAKFGPWELEPINGVPPDVLFFDRCKAGGIDNMKSLGAISYHHGGVEIRRKRGFYG